LLAGTIALLPLRAFADLDEARRLATDGHIEQALEHVDEVLDSRPNDIAAQLLRGVLLSRNGQSDAAIDAFLAIAEERPDLPEPHNNLAVLYASQGRYNDARGALKRAIDLQPDYDVAYENLGDVYVKLAALAYTHAQRINDDNERAAQKAAATERLLDALLPRMPARAQDTSSQATAGTRERDREPGATASAAEAIVEHCVQMPGIAPASRAEQVIQWLTAHGMRARITSSGSSTSSVSRYRVLLPAQGGPAQSRAMIAQLRAKGETDLFMIARGEHANGIALGVFSKRSGAERRRSALARKGVHAQIVEHNTVRQIDAASVHARGPFVAADFAREFADITYDINDCR
jgi:cell division protein FtsN